MLKGRNGKETGSEWDSEEEKVEIECKAPSAAFPPSL